MSVLQLPANHIEDPDGEPCLVSGVLVTLRVFLHIQGSGAPSANGAGAPFVLRRFVPSDPLEVGVERTQQSLPVVVSAGAIAQTEMLWAYIRDQTAGRLKQANVHVLTGLELKNLKLLMGLVETGHDLVAVLAGRTSQAYHDLELAIYLSQAPVPPSLLPLPASAQAPWSGAIETALQMMSLTGKSE